MPQSRPLADRRRGIQRQRRRNSVNERYSAKRDGHPKARLVEILRAMSTKGVMIRL